MNLRKPLGLSSKGKFPPEYRYWTYSRLRGLMVGVSSLVKLTVRALHVQVAKGGFRANLSSICSLEWTPLSFGLVYKPVDFAF